MTLDQAAKKLLVFDEPDQPLPADFSAAEKDCLGFLSKLLKKTRELKKEQEAHQKESQRMWEEKEDLRNKLDRYLVRNLIPIMDQCRLGLGTASTASPAVQQPPENPEPQTPGDSPGEIPAALKTMKAPPGTLPEPQESASAPTASQPASQDSTAILCLKSIERQVLSLLNELGIQRVELLGKTYDQVMVDDETIPEPFEILQVSETGKSDGVVVKEVIQDLWITRKYGSINVLRKGQVNC